MMFLHGADAGFRELVDPKFCIKALYEYRARWSWASDKVAAFEPWAVI